MGTVRANLTISSTDVIATPVNVSAGKNFSANAGLVMRAKVKGTSAGSDDLTIYKENDKNVAAYLFVRNLNQDLENYIYIHNSTDSNAAVAKIGGGEFCYIPVPFDKTFKAYGTLADQLIEFMVFGEDDSDTTLG
tara:strand:+ start:2097 stop:2501 length:405 start_codon:yes stop_codon:yes gene_type:complete